MKVMQADKYLYILSQAIANLTKKITLFNLFTVLYLSTS